MQIEPIAYFRSPFATKFGVPKQSGLVDCLQGTIEFVTQYRNADALRGIDEFDYLWLVWEFSANKHAANSPVVRPPLLGGNVRMGVFATRSPFRPNRLGLSSVRIANVELDTTRGPLIHVLGADLMDGTPIYDIKPYVAYADCHPDARSGFVDKHAIRRLTVIIPQSVSSKFNDSQLEALRKVLELDPRPQYHDDPKKVYGMMYAGIDVKFCVADGVLTVVD
ncbi:tRNA (N6-threonylcarbamoyladenosine(37)-N6)-methyltransferase TrmO [Prevotella sp.]|uniref:tRNA (N6-threonylcarbamoyladenosine(37)-N6)-methyltransferase TrmO n=1 Tax=Prevotella sp. TaxID=59823 RepID=UPI002E77CC64|nr:tRNA (N6-threonylcarbamoyladenosine(37)-N6)-methyltransferase TrmO [Prevotella sp.]MEE0671010.1 tRNA (N6-threonylcarbamoyladenosine(37)-N6)-methyltransferase TrmO [Prevotella sp.]